MAAIGKPAKPTQNSVKIGPINRWGGFSFNSELVREEAEGPQLGPYESWDAKGPLALHRSKKEGDCRPPKPSRRTPSIVVKSS